MITLPLVLHAPERRDYAERLISRFGFAWASKVPEQGYWMALDYERLSLQTVGKHGAVYAEFVEGAARHRREHGGGRGQPVARAIGLKSAKTLPSVVDATAGLGRDSFVLASLGCEVTMIERSPAAAALLYDALERARSHPDTADIAARMHLVHADAIQWLQQLGGDKPDVVFVDPMFPDTDKKSAAAKKDMQAFQQVIGDDMDSAALLLAAIAAADKRVVVKRPRLGPAIAGATPSVVIDGKSTRFDLYINKAMS